MLTQEQGQEIFERLRKHSSCDEVELMIGGGAFALTRFANNGITQNVAEENYSLSVRVNMDGRTARATTNKKDDQSLRRVALQAEALARVQHPDPDLLAMPDAAEVEPSGVAEGGANPVFRGDGGDYGGGSRGAGGAHGGCGQEA